VKKENLSTLPYLLKITLTNLNSVSQKEFIGLGVVSALLITIILIL